MRDNDFITGLGTAQVHVLRPKITAKGERYVDNGWDVNKGEPPMGGHNVTVTGDGNAVNLNSPGSSQTINITITEDNRKQILRLAESIEQAAPVLQLHEEDTELPARLREAAGQNDPGVVTRLLLQVQTALIDKSGTALGNSIIFGAGTLFTHFGIPLPLG